MSDNQVSYLNDKTILLTGGTGSFGNQFIKMVLKDHNPKKLIVFSRDELKQHEQSQAYNDDRLRFFIGDVRDKERLFRAMHGVDYVVHAAALKHVPACEYNPMEALQTNVLGGKNVIDAALDAGVERVIALSTDKAVSPTNMYGATKLCAEKLFVQSIAYSRNYNTKISCVRYGNVVGSRGSIIPLLLEQRKSGRVTITDSRMTRFWITLQQGVDFVIRSLTLMKGGEVFVPRIPSMNIMDLKEAIAPDCEVDYIGIRPGEKLHEVLIASEEARNAVQVEDFYIIVPNYPGWIDHTWQNAEAVPEGFCYASDTNDDVMTLEQMRDLIDI